MADLGEGRSRKGDRQTLFARAQAWWAAEHRAPIDYYNYRAVFGVGLLIFVALGSGVKLLAETGLRTVLGATLLLIAVPAALGFLRWVRKPVDQRLVQAVKRHDEAMDALRSKEFKQRQPWCPRCQKPVSRWRKRCPHCKNKLVNAPAD